MCLSNEEFVGHSSFIMIQLVSYVMLSWRFLGHLKGEILKAFRLARWWEPSNSVVFHWGLLAKCFLVCHNYGSRYVDINRDG